MSEHKPAVPPGPWIVHGPYGDGFDRHFSLNHEIAGEVSSAYFLDVPVLHSTPEAMANAKLLADTISKLPELLQQFATATYYWRAFGLEELRGPTEREDLASAEKFMDEVVRPVLRSFEK